MALPRLRRFLPAAALGSALLLFGPFIFSQQTATAPPAAPAKSNVTAADFTREQMEHFLLTARIIGERAAGKGITNSKRVTLTDGQYTHDAHIQDIDVYKAEYRTKTGIEKNFRDSYKFNIAAYRLDKIMDLNIVPVCVPREINGKPAAVDWWVDNVQFDEEGRREKNAEPPDENEWTRQLNTIRDFDQLIYNDDRNQGNLLIDKSWKLWAIDHSRAFRDKSALRDPDVLRRISAKMLAAMRSLSEQQLEDSLEPYITKEDIEALLVRRELLVKFFESEITSKGEDSVLTDIPRRTQRVTIP
jgi:hypothetical protein